MVFSCLGCCSVLVSSFLVARHWGYSFLTLWFSSLIYVSDDVVVCRVMICWDFEYICEINLNTEFCSRFIALLTPWHLRYYFNWNLSNFESNLVGLCYVWTNLPFKRISLFCLIVWYRWISEQTFLPSCVLKLEFSISIPFLLTRELLIRYFHFMKCKLN